MEQQNGRYSVREHEEETHPLAGIPMTVKINGAKFGVDFVLEYHINGPDELNKVLRFTADYVPEADWIIERNGSRRPVDHDRMIEPEPAQDGPQPSQVSGAGRRVTDAPPDSPSRWVVTEDAPAEGERYRDIVALKRVKEARDGKPDLDYWVPYYEDETGDYKKIGRIWTWNPPDEPQIAEQLRALVSEDHRRNPKVTELDKHERFRAWYTLDDIGNGRKAAKFHRLEALHPQDD